MFNCERRASRKCTIQTIVRKTRPKISQDARTPVVILLGYSRVSRREEHVGLMAPDTPDHTSHRIEVTDHQRKEKKLQPSLHTIKKTSRPKMRTDPSSSDRRLAAFAFLLLLLLLLAAAADCRSVGAAVVNAKVSESAQLILAATTLRRNQLPAMATIAQCVSHHLSRTHPSARPFYIAASSSSSALAEFAAAPTKNSRITASGSGGS